MVADSPSAPASGRALLTLERDELLRLDSVLSREWLETDGRGGYASSTPILCPTRRYHGLLVAPPPGSPRRYVFVSRFEEHIGRRHANPGGDASTAGHPLSIARYRSLWAPHGHRNLERFELVPFPSFLYRIGGTLVRREVLSVRGRHVTLVRYAVRNADDDVELALRPLLPCREADALTVENPHLDGTVTTAEDGHGFSLQPYGALPPVTIRWSGEGELASDPTWYKDLEYREELARGYPGHEDQWSPGVLRLAAGGDRDVVVAISIGTPPEDPAELWRTESRRRALGAAGGVDGSATEAEDAPGPSSRPSSCVRTTLDETADAFLYRASDGRPGILAGFPWFGEWGRDTYIALPGLTLARGDLTTCGEVLTAALPYLRGGLLPNVFGADPDDSHYGSADASLWYARAVRAYDLAGAGEDEVLERFRPALTGIAEGYTEGTGLDIRCDAGGLPRMGSDELNATWMDAMTPDGPVTPRHGFPVETCALFYQLLAYLEELAGRAGDEVATKRWQAAKRRAGRTFLEYFWIEEKRYLADVVTARDIADDAPFDPARRDESVRPNMVIAAALELSPLSRGRRTDVVQRAAVELLTPRGLRTLAPKNPDYVGRYAGDPRERDEAYHQGTVWPWLLGFFCEAWLRAIGTRKRDLDYLRGLLDGFEPHLSEAGLLHCSEVYDGDPPHAPGGTIAQAWSTSELLRAYAMLARSSP